MKTEPLSINTMSITQIPNQFQQVKTSKNLEILCSSTKVDQRFAVMIEIYDQKVGTVNIGFSFGNSNSIASWGISTFTVLTGSCDPSCSSCSFSNDPTSCVSCKQFLDKGAGGRCNQCTAGFNLSTANTSNIYCQKCPIEYLSCNPGQEVCFYKNLTSDVNKTNCKFNTPSSKSLSNSRLSINLRCKYRRIFGQFAHCKWKILTLSMRALQYCRTGSK